MRLAPVACAALVACSKPAPVPELAVPDVEQDTDYTCSASALEAVLAYYGVNLGEPGLASELGATPQDGAPPEAIAKVARVHGLDASVRDDLTRADLAAELAERHPTIVDLQAWADPPRTSWTDDWDDGHYVVLVAIEGDTFVFEDPSVTGKRSTLSAAELDARWHDEDAKRRHAHTAILFHTQPPAHPASVDVAGREHMD
jgi:predicted double-glycine peptidase